MAVTRLMAVALLALAIEARAQSHDAAPRKVPTVSRVAPLATSPVAAAGTAHVSADPHATAPQATSAAGGYVTTGARGRGAEGGHGGGASRPKPVVSGMVAPHGPSSVAGVAAAATHGSATSATAAGGAHGAPIEEHVTVATAPAADHDVATVTTGAAAAMRDTSRPVRLNDVHERLRVALAEAHLEGRVDGLGGPTTATSATAASASPAPRRPARVTLAWPGPRWRVIWPAIGRVSVRWPEAGHESPPAVPAVPLTPVVPQR